MERFNRLLGLGFLVALLAAHDPHGAAAAPPTEEVAPSPIELAGFNLKSVQPSGTAGEVLRVVELIWENTTSTRVTAVQWIVSGENGPTFTSGGPVNVAPPVKSIAIKSASPSNQVATIVANLVARNTAGGSEPKALAMTLGGGSAGRLGAQSLIAIPIFGAVEFAFSNPNADAASFLVEIRTAAGKEFSSMTLPRDVVLGKFSELPIGTYSLAVTIKYSDGSTSSPAEQSFAVTKSDVVPTETPTPDPTIGIPPTLVPTASATVPPPSSKKPRVGISAPLILARKGKTWAFCRIHSSLGKGKAFVQVKQKNAKKLRLKTRKGATKKQYRTYVARLKLHPKAKFTAACQWLTNSQSILGATSRIYSPKK